jgi:nitroreductase
MGVHLRGRPPAVGEAGTLQTARRRLSVVCGDANESDTWIEDCAIASILAQMTALSLELGSCWIQVRNRHFDDQTTSEQYIQKLLGIPEHLKVESIIALGYPAEERPLLMRASLKDAKIHLNGYRG